MSKSHIAKKVFFVCLILWLSSCLTLPVFANNPTTKTLPFQAKLSWFPRPHTTTVLIPNAEVKDCTFINSSDGWCMAGINQHGYDGLALFQTNDSGTSWKEVSRGPKSYPAQFNGPFVNALASQISFVNKQVGWMYGAFGQNTPNAYWLYVTRDGGKTWNKRTFPSVDNTKRIVNVRDVLFFNEQDGAMIVKTKSTHSTTYWLYVTHNQGETWSESQAGPKQILLQQTMPITQMGTVTLNISNGLAFTIGKQTWYTTVFQNFQNIEWAVTKDFKKVKATMFSYPMKAIPTATKQKETITQFKTFVQHNLKRHMTTTEVTARFGDFRVEAGNEKMYIQKYILFLNPKTNLVSNYEKASFSNRDSYSENPLDMVDTKLLKNKTIGAELILHFGADAENAGHLDDFELYSIDPTKTKKNKPATHVYVYDRETNKTTIKTIH